MSVETCELAAQMIEALLADDTGACQYCGEYILLGNPHAVDCEAQALLRGLRQP